MAPTVRARALRPSRPLLVRPQASRVPVCPRLVECTSGLSAATASTFSPLLATGGGSASQFWLQTISNTLNIEIEKPKTGEFGAALGAARLAISSIIKEPIGNIMSKPEIEKKIIPDQRYVNLYQTAYEKFTQGHSNLRGLQ